MDTATSPLLSSRGDQPNWAPKPSSQEVSEGTVDGILIPHTKKDDSVQQYISSIPYYRGKTIPQILTRPKSLLSHEWNYFDLKSFLQNFGQHDESELWVVAGLLAETGIAGSIPLFGQVKAASKHVKENECKKQVLCKKSKDKIVFLINVTDSTKDEGSLNARYSERIMIIDASKLNPRHPAGFYEHMPPPPMAVPAGGFVEPLSQRAADDVKVKIFKLLRHVDSGQSDIQLQEENPTSLTNIMETLSATVTYVIDPNKIDSQSNTVEWFRNMTLRKINDLIERNIAQPERGGKIRSSKPRVTKTRKSTKRRRQQRRRRTSRK